jgi:hypothetical protein
MFTMKALASLAVLAMFSGCGESHGSAMGTAKGYILGHDSDGVAVIGLSTGKKEYLRGREEGHLWWCPVWCEAISRFACVDHYTSISLLPIGKGPAEVLYQIPADADIDALALTPGGALVFVVARHSTGNSSLMTLDLSSRKHRVVAEANFDSDLIQAISDKNVIVGRRTRTSSDSAWVETVVSVELADGKVTELFGLEGGAWFAASPDARTILKCGPDEILRVYDLNTRLFHEVNPHGLSGRSGGQRGCFVGNDEVVLFREHDTKLPIGFYRLNVRDGNATYLTSESVWHPNFLGKRPN